MGVGVGVGDGVGFGTESSREMLHHLLLTI